MKYLLAGIHTIMVLLTIICGCASKEVPSKMEKIAPPMAIVEEPLPREQSAPKRVVLVTAQWLNLRESPSPESTILKVLKKDAKLTVLGEQERWLQVKTLTNQVGWVYGRYVTEYLGPIIELGSVTVKQKAPPKIGKATKQPRPIPSKIEKNNLPTASIPAPVSSQPPADSSQTTLPPSVAAIPGKSVEDSADTDPFRSVALTRVKAIELYKHHRQTMVDTDFSAFLDSIHDPPGPEEANAEEFVQMKDQFLGIMPDPAAWEVLRFAGNADAALLVVRSDLENPCSISLKPLFFIADNGQWKVQFDFFSDIFPRQDPETDQANIAKALKTNPMLQLTGAATAQQTPTGISPSTSSPPPATDTASPATGTDTPDASSPQNSEFTKEDAMAVYSHHRQTMVDADFSAFLDSIHDPPGPEEANAEEFVQMKDQFLGIMPDPAAWEVLRFAGNADAALLVVRSDLDNPDSITLKPLFFIADSGQWKVQFDFFSDIFPRQDPETDQANIAKALKTNPMLQLTGAELKKPR